MSQTEKERSSRGGIASIVGILANLLLATGKIITGALFGAVSVLADGLNNLTDCGSSVISLVSFKLSSKPADKEHPYGHERIEYVCSMAVAFLILLIAFEVGKEALGKIITPQDPVFSYLTLAVLGASIAVKLGLFFYNRRMAKLLDSQILLATATDCLGDCISTGVVLVTTVITHLSGLHLDGYAGLLVSLLIAWAGIGVLRETLSTLIGQAPDAALTESIKERILAHPEVLGLHDLAVYSYGPNKYFASVHVEVDARVDVMTSHELVDDIEREFARETSILLTGHLDPIVTDDPEVNEMRARVGEIARGLSPDFSVHDFRMVKGERHTNLLFDVAIPYGTALTHDEIRSYMEDAISAINPAYRVVMTVEHAI